LLPSSFTRSAVRLAKKAGLSGIGLHSRRQTHAIMLLSAGVPVTNVAKRLGHWDAYTTAKIYAHALPDTDQDLAATWDKVSAENAQPKRVAQIDTDKSVEKVVKN
jgi:integrase